jgi:hypothetical protein
MLKQGTIEAGDPATLWMNPLLLSLNKNKKNISREDAGPRPETDEFISKEQFEIEQQEVHDNILDGARLCFDGRALNTALTEPSRNNVPEINNIMTKLRNYNILSAIDLKKGYWQCPVHEPHRVKTSFKWDGKVYQWAGSPFGVKHLTHHFQSLMEKVLQKHDAYCVVFVDDIFIFSKTDEEHAGHVAAVLETLQEYNFKINQAKSQFGFRKLKCLGYVIDVDGSIHIDPDKAKKVKTFTRPRTGKAMETFLGFINFIVR